MSIPEQPADVGTPTAASLLPAGGRDADRERARLIAAALAPGVQDYRVLVLDGVPHSKERPRFDKQGRAYKSPVDAAAEEKTAWKLRPAFRQPLTGNLAVGCVFFRPNRQRIDKDNLLKHVLDAGNGIAWVDDAQVTAGYQVIELDIENPRTLLVVTRHVSSMDRSNVGATTGRLPRKRKG